MVKKYTIVTCESGSAVAFVAAFLPVLLLVMGLTVDTGRMYAVQNRLQLASDTALLGAVATRSTLPINMEFPRLFTANYPDGYLGSQLDTVNISETAPGSGAYESQITVTVPQVIMGIFSRGNAASAVNVRSEVQAGISPETNRRFEIVLALDNSGSMGGPTKLNALKTASSELVNILFGNAEHLDNIHVSLIPFDDRVNVGLDLAQRLNMVQDSSLAEFNWRYVDSAIPPPPPAPPPCPSQSQPVCPDAEFFPPVGPVDEEGGGGGGGQGPGNNSDPVLPDEEGGGLPLPPNNANRDAELSGRNLDSPRNNYDDYAVNPPTSNELRFRMPCFFGERPAQNNWLSVYITCFTAFSEFVPNARMRIGLSDKSEILSAINTMHGGRTTRLNLGALWGSLALSENWAGLWIPEQPNFPATHNDALTDKSMVLMTDGRNTVFTSVISANGLPVPDRSDDDVTTRGICAGMKARGITIYTIGFGNPVDLNEPLLRDCASQGRYFNAATPALLRERFAAVADDIQFRAMTLRR